MNTTLISLHNYAVLRVNNRHLPGCIVYTYLFPSFPPSRPMNSVLDEKITIVQIHDLFGDQKKLYERFDWSVDGCSGEDEW
jgi:hypothetical protein